MNPKISPAMARVSGRWDRAPNSPKITIHNAEEALSKAPVCEGTHCMAHTCRPLQTETPRSDIISMWPQWPSSWRKENPRQKATAMSSTPLMKNRTPANSRGGRLSTPTRVAR
jgi:hypothetical protein